LVRKGGIPTNSHCCGEPITSKFKAAREEERQPGNTFRITFRHANGQPTGTIDVYQGEAEHFSVELEAIAAFLRAALIANKNSN
jgi:hypothetical protein